MRLLHIITWRFQEFHGNPPPYVITSHRWTSQELTFQELTGPSLPTYVKQKAGYGKLLNFCKAVLDLIKICPKLDVEWIWIDTCCIDKTNSVELQEALNSMFKWYAEAEVCLAYLHDVVSLDQNLTEFLDSFEASEWHRRGWCLQELLAPMRIFFYNKEWEVCGRKETGCETPWMNARATSIYPLNHTLSEVTGISSEVLWDFSSHVGQLSFEERRSWMRGRSTTRVEDQVYCQLGIFRVFMPLIYGEGDHAMVRLEAAIAAKTRPTNTAAILPAERTATPPFGRSATPQFERIASPPIDNSSQPSVNSSATTPPKPYSSRKFLVWYKENSRPFVVSVQNNETGIDLKIALYERMDQGTYNIEPNWELGTGVFKDDSRVILETDSVASISERNLYMFWPNKRDQK